MTHSLVDAAVAGDLGECRRLYAERGCTRDATTWVLLGGAAHGHLEVCQWLHETFGLTIEDARGYNNCALRFAAQYGHLEVCQWLHKTFCLTPADARADNNYALSAAAGNGHLGVCKWLRATFALTPADARAGNNWALRCAAKNGHLAVCQWFHATFGLAAFEWEPVLATATVPVAAWIAALA